MDEQLRKAEDEIASGDLARAQTRLHTAGKRYPGEERVWELLADVCLRLGNPHKAGRVLLLCSREDETTDNLRRNYLAAAGRHQRPFAWHDVRRAKISEGVEARLSSLYGGGWRSPRLGERPAIGCLFLLLAGAVLVRACSHLLR